MLSFPEPSACDSAMKVISQSMDSGKHKSVLLSKGALTLIDYLNSNLNTYRQDSIDFLLGLEPSGSEWSSEKWISWIKENGV